MAAVVLLRLLGPRQHLVRLDRDRLFRGLVLLPVPLTLVQFEEGSVEAEETWAPLLQNLFTGYADEAVAVEFPFDVWTEEVGGVEEREEQGDEKERICISNGW